ncbi:hypothetical protein M3D15_08720 [Pseudoclavibacter alba]|uniref:Uncharacterized protein n=1 Tax=Pseudoclavibacter albus TaxID=272241 RepID=A0ABT2HYL2_9MICO|nr:hypothetical protein [Pseudoclavibacter alba]MCT2043406.1 hypothetical protein [Pseudoclavibacter alba]
MTGKNAHWLPNAIAIVEHDGRTRRFAADYAIGLTTDQVLALGQLLDLQPLEVIQDERIKSAVLAIYDAESHAIAQRKRLARENTPTP